MIQRMLASALFAGCAAGLLAALLHFAFIQPLLLQGEQYESGALVHFQGVASGEAPAHSHDHAATPEAQPEAGHDHATHEHSHGDAAEVSTLKRNSLTVLFTGTVYIAYALLMVAAFGVAEHFGHKVGTTQGILWGLAGFVALQLAPAMGLAPELPGTPAADLTDRQVWWLGTVLASLLAATLFGFGKGPLSWVVAALLLALPHVIGAPHLESYAGVAPPELAGEFSARALGVALIAWLSLGAIASRLWNARALQALG
jgi:cobalt transporter subunit CbtA